MAQKTQDTFVSSCFPSKDVSQERYYPVQENQWCLLSSPQLDTCKKHLKEDNGEPLANKDFLKPARLVFVIHRLGRTTWDFSMVFSQATKQSSF